MSNWLHTLQPIERLGEIEQCLGLNLVAKGPPQVFIGELCDILDHQNRVVTQAEVLGFEKGSVFLMPFANSKIRLGFKVRASGSKITIGVGGELLGRIVDAFANALDSKGPVQYTERVALDKATINPLHREPISERVLTGIHAVDSLLPLGKGQRIGLFAGSGVGKSTLLGQFAKRIQSDILVIALIGERGREVQDFIREHLDEATLKKAVIVVACSDDSPLLRKQAAYTAMTIAEYFCKQHYEVMLFLDSITRFAMAQRELSLSLGELATMRGYTPSVFSLLPNLIERAGNFLNQGSITALYTVLVEGDDFNEPLADNMRALLDGHLILTRELAHQGHFPAIDVLQSVSRLATHLFNPQELQLMRQVIALLNQYHQNKMLIEVGAYKPGSNVKLDHAVNCVEAINKLLQQTNNESLPVNTLLQRFSEIIQ